MSHPSALTAARHRALALRAGGDPATAGRLLADTLAAARPSFGEDHPEVLSAAHLLARLHRETDDPAAARRVLEEAFAAGERRFGHADPLMLAISFDLGSVAEELGNRHEARRNYLRVATAGPAVLDEDHAAVRTARRYLGDTAPVTRLSTPPPAVDPFALSGPTMALNALPGPPTPAAHLPPADPGPPVTPPTPPARPAPGPRPAQPAPATPRPATAVNPAQRDWAPPHANTQAAPQADIREAATGPTPEPAPPSRQPVAQHQPSRHDRYQMACPPAAHQPEPEPDGPGRTVVAAIAVATVLLVAVLAVAAVLTGRALGARPAGPVAPGVQPAVSGPPPGDLRLRDDASTIALSWSDPSRGAVSFVVAGGRAGQPLGAMATVDPGQTSYTVNGLNTRVDYCFTVLAVHSTDSYANSGQVCTTRQRTLPPR